MKILSIDTSGNAASVCLWDNKLIYEAMTVNKYTHSVNIMPMIDDSFVKSGYCIDDVDLFAVVSGPGSFTGIRIGVSTVKSLAQACNKPCVAINKLEALALSVSPTNLLICPILDARANQVYAAAFQYSFPPIRKLDDCAISLDDYLDKIITIDKRFMFVGDAVPVFSDRIKQKLGDNAIFSDVISIHPQPRAIAKLADYYSDRAVGYDDLEPYYLRLPQAERLRLAGKLKI